MKCDQRKKNDLEKKEYIYTQHFLDVAVYIVFNQALVWQTGVGLIRSFEGIFFVENERTGSDYKLRN